MNIKLLVATILFLLEGIVFAAVPADLMYQNKPIDPLCFSDVQNDATLIDLKNCGLIKEKYKIKARDAKLIKKGYLGFDWQTTDENPAGYSYYKYFPAGKDEYWLYSINSGGGSGQFSTIYWVKRKDSDTLAIKVLAGGDRCNGGVHDLSEANNQLTFSANLTAYDFLALSKKTSPNLKAYDDLAACAVCCVAKAFYQLSPDLQTELKYVELEKDTDTEPSIQGIYQTCFNKLFSTYVNAGKVRILQSNLDEFAQEFEKICLKK